VLETSWKNGQEGYSKCRPIYGTGLLQKLGYSIGMSVGCPLVLPAVFVPYQYHSLHRHRHPLQQQHLPKPLPLEMPFR
jgi:hypothetical protein